MKNLFQSFKKFLFENSCIFCEKKLNENEIYLCDKCHKNLKGTSSLKHSKDVYFLWEYDNIIKKVIENLKFNNIHSLSDILGDIIFEKLFYIIEQKDIDYVIPVPVSKTRYKQRGFNQAEELLKSSGIDFLITKRVKNTEHMYKITSKNARVDNIKGSFEISQKLNGKNILIFDDIVTTGATFLEMENAIKNKNSDVKITYFAIARAKNYKYGSD